MKKLLVAFIWLAAGLLGFMALFSLPFIIGGFAEAVSQKGYDRAVWTLVEWGILPVLVFLLVKLARRMAPKAP